MNKYLTFIILVTLLLSACAEPDWTNVQYADQFRQNCNRNNSPHLKAFCQCQLVAAKASYPNPEKYFALATEDLQAFNARSFKQCVNWEFLSHEIRKQCESSVGQNKAIDCQCNIAKLKAAIPDAAKYTALTREAKNKVAMDAAILCAKEQAAEQAKSQQKK